MNDAKKILILLIFLFIVLSLSFFVALPAAAHTPQEFQTKVGEAQGNNFSPFPLITCRGVDCNFCELFHTFQHVILLLIYFAFIAALISIIIGAFLIMISGGNPGTFASGKNAIFSAVIGVVIVLAAWVVVNTIIQVLANPSEFPLPWNQLSC